MYCSIMNPSNIYHALEIIYHIYYHYTELIGAVSRNKKKYILIKPNNCIMSDISNMGATAMGWDDKNHFIGQFISHL